MDGYGRGWSGPGAKSSPANREEQEQYTALKRRLEAEEAEKKEQVNRERVARGEKPMTDGVGVKAKKLFKRMMM